MTDVTFRVDCESKIDRRYGRGHIGDACCVARLRQTATFSEFGGESHCTICGAFYKAGDVWKHKPTGVHIFVGHTCTAKYQSVRTDAEWRAWHREMAAKRAQAAKEQKWATARAERRASNPDLFARLEALAANTDASSFARDFAADLTRRIDQWGMPSEKQLALLVKLETEARERVIVNAQRAAEVHVPAPTGRVTFTGTIVSVKTYESDFGSVTKLTVKVTTDAGIYLVFVTAPQALCWKEAQDGQPGQWRDVKGMRGSTVTLKATLTRGRDEFFALGKRPNLIEFKEVA
jgi:hypothetical protein